MTRSVVMIAYSFPPEGNAGAYRPLRFVRSLTRSDWEVHVISAGTKNHEREDPGLLSLVPEAVEVVQVRSCDPWQALQARRARHIRDKIAQSCAHATPIKAVRQ